MNRVKTKIWDAESIKAMRLQYGISQETFSSIMGTRQQTISEWELNFYKPGNAYTFLLDTVEDELARLWQNVKGDKPKFAQAVQLNYGIRERIKPGRKPKSEVQQN